MNTSPKIDPDVAQSYAAAEKDTLSKIAPSRRMQRRRTIATGRVETDSSSEEQPVRIFKPKLALKKGSGSTKEGTSEKTRISRRASAVGSSERTEKLTESSGKHARLKSTRHSSSKSLDVFSPQQTTTKPSSRRSRSSSMQHVSLQQQSEALKCLSGASFRQAFVSVTDKGVSSTEGVISSSKASKGRTPSSESKVASPRKSKTQTKENKSKPLSNDFEDDEDDNVSLDILNETQPDVESGEGFFAVRSFLYKQ